MILIQMTPFVLCRRLSLESSQLSESVDELRHGRFSNATERNSNVRATLLIDYLNRDPVYLLHMI